LKNFINIWGVCDGYMVEKNISTWKDAKIGDWKESLP